MWGPGTLLCMSVLWWQCQDSMSCVEQPWNSIRTCTTLLYSHTKPCTLPFVGLSSTCLPVHLSTANSTLACKHVVHFVHFLYAVVCLLYIFLLGWIIMGHPVWHDWVFCILYYFSTRETYFILQSIWMAASNLCSSTSYFEFGWFKTVQTTRWHQNWELPQRGNFSWSFT